MKLSEIERGQIIHVEYPPHGSTGHMLVANVGEDLIHGYEVNNEYEGHKCWTTPSCVLKLVENYSIVNWMKLKKYEKE